MPDRKSRHWSSCLKKASAARLATSGAAHHPGPDYLIDTFLIELIVHHAETLDSALAAEVKDIYKKAVARPGDLAMFRRAAQGIVAYASAIPEEDLEDEMGREAYRTIGILVKQVSSCICLLPSEKRGLTYRDS